MNMKKPKPHTITLTDLPGVKRKQSKGVCVRSVTHAMQHFRAGKIITAAGTYGALTVWRADDGVYQGEFQRYLRTIGDIKTASYKGIHAWLKKWFPRLESMD